MVCSSTLRAMAVIHSAKRWKPRRVKPQAKALSRACQRDQVSVASFMMRLLCRGRLGSEPPGRFRPGDAAFNTVRPLSYCEFFFGKLVSNVTYAPEPDTRAAEFTWPGDGFPSQERHENPRRAQARDRAHRPGSA